MSAWLHLRSQICLRHFCFDTTTEELCDGWKTRRSLTRHFNLSTARTPLPRALTLRPRSALAGPRPTAVFPAGPSSSPVRMGRLSLWSRQVHPPPGKARGGGLPDINNPLLHYLVTSCLPIFFFLLFNCPQQQLPADPSASEQSPAEKLC